MKKIISIVLAVLMCAAVLASCGGGSETGGTTSASSDNASNTASTTTETTTTAFDPFANMETTDYNGYTFTILNGCTASWFSRNSMLSDGLSGEPINDAVFARNSRVEEEFGVKITEISDNDYVNTVKNAVASGSKDFDVATITLMSVYAVAQSGILKDMKQVENIEFTNPWWDQNAVADMSVGNRLYFCTGAADTTRLDSIRTLYFNKDLISELKLENPYRLVDDHKWTIDKYKEMAAAAVNDLNGDGIFTDADRYGIVSYTDIVGDMLIAACGETYVFKDSDDYLVAMSGNERVYDIYEKVRSIMNDDHILFNIRTVDSAYLRGMGDRVQEAMFASGQALFYSECMAWTRALRAQEADFGVLPPPMYDETQDRYYSVIINPFVFSIPNTQNDTELARTGMILEALNAASYDTVIPAYIDNTLYGKVARDADTVRMLELVFDQLRYNIHVSAIATRRGLLDTMAANKTNVSSYFTSINKVNSKTVKKINDDFRALK